MGIAVGWINVGGQAGRNWLGAGGGGGDRWLRGRVVVNSVSIYRGSRSSNVVHNCKSQHHAMYERVRFEAAI